MDEKYELAKSSRDRFDSLVKEVLSNVKPSKQEIDTAKFAINDIMGRLKKGTPRDVEILLLGSVARGTQVKGNSDMDVFLLFPRKMKSKEIEKKGLEIAKKIVNRKKNESYIVKYAEHPYTRIFLKDLNMHFDIVPAYKIETAKERGTAVDRTQLHNEFINSRLTERQRDDVRVLKAFLKAHRIYGAEAKTEGFSGYLCELLTYNYGSFLNVITGMANIRLPLVVSFSRSKVEGNNDSELVKQFGKNFVVIDPTDNDRNVAANVSDESLFRFVIASRMLLRLPNIASFYGEKHDDLYTERKLLGIRDELGANLYVINFGVPDIADDIIWQQVRRTRLRINDLLNANGFDVVISLQNTGERGAAIGFFISNAYVSISKIMGPNLRMGKAVEAFMKAHSKAVLLSIEGDRVYAIEKAKYMNPESLIREFLGSKSTMLPSYLNPKKATLYVNKIPEAPAKLIYSAFVSKFSI